MQMSSRAVREDSIIWITGFNSTHKSEAVVKALGGIKVITRQDGD